MENFGERMTTKITATVPWLAPGAPEASQLRVDVGLLPAT